MLDKLKAIFRPARATEGSWELVVEAAELSPPAMPKVKPGQVARQSMSRRTATATGDVKLSETDRRTANTDLLTLRTGTTTKSTINDLSKVSPDLSASVWAYQRLVVTRNFTAVGYGLDGSVSPEATVAAQQVISRMNYLQDYTDGFSGMSSLHALGEALSRELRVYGACSAELVLDKARLPDRLVPFSTTQLEFMEDKSGYVYPVQKVNGSDIPLDIPTFFYEVLDQDLQTAYSDSPMESALQAVLADTEFTNDVRRVIKRALHPRLAAMINSEKFRKSVPPDILGDPQKLQEFAEQAIASLETTVNGLEPDDALVHFDTVEFDYLNNGNVTLNREYEALTGMINAKLATGTKSPPAVLGHGAGSQNIASTETLLFLRYCEGVQQKINSLISRALTLGVRLMGIDAYVVFEFDRVDLRPDSELEAFRAMRQSRILDLLSLGLISDEQASILLTGKLPPAGAPKLSGTFFRAGTGKDPDAEPAPNPFSNTSADPGGPRDGKKQTPEQTKGAPQKAK